MTSPLGQARSPFDRRSRTVLKLTSVSVPDIPTVQALARKIWHDCYPGMISREQIAYMLDKMYSTRVIERELASGVFYGLAWRGSKAVGYLSYSFDQRRRELTLHKVYLLKKQQGKGFGQQLLEYVILKAQQLKAKTISLRVNRNNLKAITAYLDADFVVTGTSVADIGGGFVMDDYIMQCRLE